MWHKASIILIVSLLFVNVIVCLVLCGSRQWWWYLHADLWICSFFFLCTWTVCLEWSLIYRDCITTPTLNSWRVCVCVWVYASWDLVHMEALNYFYRLFAIFFIFPSFFIAHYRSKWDDAFESNSTLVVEIRKVWETWEESGVKWGTWKVSDFRCNIFFIN